MDARTKAKISRGIRKAHRRKRMSVAMKAVWAKRRTENAHEVSLWSDDSLVEAARTLLGREEVRRILVNRIKEVL
jgi:hypothetical protein